MRDKTLLDLMLYSPGSKMQLTFQKISTGNGLQTTNYLPNGKFGSWFDTLGGTVSVWQFGGSVRSTFVTH